MSRTATQPPPNRPTGPRRAGTVLIVTMWVLAVLAGMVLVLANSMRVEQDCSANEAARQQASAVESGAVQYVLACVDGLDGEVPTEQEMPCEAVPVGDGAFWIIRPDYQEEGQQTYGLVDEASKLNLNTATVDMLAELPDMPAEVAASIVDWRDSDSDLTVGGAESEYYLLLADPYECKNSPLETVEELLLIKQADRTLLFGEDLNRNSVLDPNENDGDETDPPDNRDGRLDAGIFNLVTVYSSEPAPSGGGGGGSDGGDGGGSQLVNVNQASNNQLSEVLQDSVGRDRIAGILNLARLGRPFQNILDFYFRTGMTMEEFGPIADRLTTQTGQAPRGLINVNTAPKAVLLCLPGLEESDAAALVAARGGENADLSSIAWVAGVLDPTKAVGIGSLITAKSYQFSADIVSVAGNGRAFRRCRIVVDTSGDEPRVIYREDLTALGWPLDPQILQDLRDGASLDEVVETTAQENR